ncbi:MAG: translocation/assembly module TamB domain-containing protein [Thermodesulfovibrionales bacterium]
MKRAFLWIALSLLLVLTAGFVFLAFLLATEAGLQRLFPLLSRYVPGEVTVAELRGRLIGPLSIKGLEYRTGSFSLFVDSLSLDWMPYFLASGEIYITRLTAEGITYIAAGEEKPSPGPKRVRLPDIRLPLAVTLQNAEMKRIAVYPTQKGPPLVVNEAFLELSSGWNTLSLHELRAKGPLFTVRMIGKLRPQGEYPLGFQVDWLVRPDGYPEVQGSGEVTGSLAHLKVSQQVTVPVDLEIEAEVSDVLSAPSWKADLEIRRFVPRDIRKTWPALRVRGSVRASGTLSSFGAGAALAADGIGIGAVDGAFRLQYRSRKWRVEDLRLAVRDSPLRVLAQGEYSPGSDGRGSITASGGWTGLSWPLRGGRALFTSPEGSFRVWGSIDDYTVRLAFDLAGGNVPPGHWTLSAQGDRTGLTAPYVRGQFLEGVVEGRGRIQWRPELQWSAFLTGKGLHPGLILPAWPGEIAFEAAASGSRAGGVTRAAVQVSRAAGTLRGYPFRAALQASMEGDAYRLDAFTAASGSARIRASGKVGAAWDLAGSIQAPALESLLPGARGSFSGSFSLAGPRDAPRIAAAVHGRNIALQDFVVSGVSSLDAEAALDLQDSSDSRFVLHAAGLRAKGRALRSLDLQAQGRLSGHDVRLTLLGAEESLSLAARGSYGEGRWEGTLLSSSLRSRELGAWSLEKPGPLLIDGAAGRVKAGQWCWSKRSSRLCAEGEWNAEGKSYGSLLAVQIPWSLLQPLLPPEVKITGTVTGTLAGTYERKALRAEAYFRGTPGSVAYGGEGDRQVMLQFREIAFESRLDEKALSARLEIPLTEGGSVKGDFTLPGFPLPSFSLRHQPLRGHLTVNFPRLDFLPLAYREVKEVKGSFTAAVQLAGTPAKPLVTVRAALENASASVPRLGIRLEDIRLVASDAGDGRAHFEGRVRSGPGTVKLTGEAGLASGEGWTARLRIEGEQFMAVDIPEAKVFASPDLEVLARNGRVEVEGVVRIPRASIKLRDVSRTVSVSPDVVVVNGVEREQQEEKIRLYTRIRIVLGDKVFFEGFGLIGRITGSVLAVDTPDRLTAGTGELEVVNGIYRAYGHTLNIDRGRFIFAGGPINNPRLDVRAVRTAGEVTAGVTAQGSLKNPRLSLFSTPSMDQANILSYLVLGRPLQSATGEEGQLLYKAASSLSFSGGEFLAQRIGGAFGIRDIHIEQGAEFREAALIVGTYLSPHLYVSYGIGLFEPVNRVRIRYELSKKLLLQVESGLESGADLFYRIER